MKSCILENSGLKKFFLCFIWRTFPGLFLIFYPSSVTFAQFFVPFTSGYNEMQSHPYIYFAFLSFCLQCFAIFFILLFRKSLPFLYLYSYPFILFYFSNFFVMISLKIIAAWYFHSLRYFTPSFSKLSSVLLSFLNEMFWMGWDRGNYKSKESHGENRIQSVAGEVGIIGTTILGEEEPCASRASNWANYPNCKSLSGHSDVCSEGRPESRALLSRVSKKVSFRNAGQQCNAPADVAQ